MFSSYMLEFKENRALDIQANPPIAWTVNEHLAEAFPRVRKLPRTSWDRKVSRFISNVPTIFKRQYDLIHQTYYGSANISDRDIPIVTSVYDMIPELHQGEMNKELVLKKKASLDRATAIVCISNATRTDLHKFYRIPDSKVHVVHLGIDAERATRDVERVSDLPEEFILFVGKRGGYKDFKTVLLAFRQLRISRPRLALICAGASFGSDEAAEIADLGLSGAVVAKKVSDRQLRFLYRRARAFVFPSQYEGFGLPILEAFVQKCPVLLADASCFPEVAGDAAWYFEPGNFAKCAAVLDELLSNDVERGEKVAHGLEVCRRLNWHESAKALAEIYRKVAF